MKTLSVITGAALVSLAWSISASAAGYPVAHDTMMTRMNVANTSATPGTSVPEPGTLALLALGIGGLGLARRRRG